MLVLVTGGPGAGKTSNMLWEFLKNPDYDNRPKFASDIPDFDRAVHGVGDFNDIEKWQDLPDGSLILVDEAQRFLRPRSGRQVPDWLGAFETHRHRGFDFIFITQHPSLIDTHVRRLVGRHHHFHRPFGVKNSIRYTWEYTQENPCTFTFKDAIRKPIKTNPEVFKLYKSTSVDTHKRQLPWGKLAIGALGVLMVIGGLGSTFYQVNKPKKEQSTITQAQPQQTTNTQSHNPYVTFDSPVNQEIKTFKPEHMIPRDSSLPWSAPYYDNLTQPSDFPRIAACIESKSKGCSCYTQQATPLEVEASLCSAIVKRGTFDNWKTQREQQSFNNAQQLTMQNEKPKPLNVPTNGGT